MRFLPKNQVAPCLHSLASSNSIGRGERSAIYYYGDDEVTDVYAWLRYIFRTTKIKNVKFKNLHFQIILNNDYLTIRIEHIGEKCRVVYEAVIDKPKRINFETELNNKIVETFRLISKSEKQGYPAL